MRVFSWHFPVFEMLCESGGSGVVIDQKSRMEKRIGNIELLLQKVLVLFPQKVRR
jgi:hypothetical protein